MCLNFTTRYSLEEPPDGQAGIRLTNGSWTGTIGQVLNKVSGLHLATCYAFVYDCRILNERDSTWLFRDIESLSRATKQLIFLFPLTKKLRQFSFQLRSKKVTFLFAFDYFSGRYENPIKLSLDANF